jgi:5-enolpyruvylshikimate-3-phosphate synthase
VQPIKTISGTVKLPGSKSLSNRILLLAALAEGTTVVRNLLVRADAVCSGVLVPCMSAAASLAVPRAQTVTVSDSLVQ